jgi:hypothetical protein
MDELSLFREKSITPSLEEYAALSFLSAQCCHNSTEAYNLYGVQQEIDLGGRRDGWGYQRGCSPQR